MNQDDKAAVIDELETASTKASRLVITLRFARREEEAALAEEKSRALRAEIDGLLARSMEQWIGDSQAVIDGLKSANRLLQRDIADIRKAKDLAGTVTRALGRLDDIVAGAGKLLAVIP